MLRFLLPVLPFILAVVASAQTWSDAAREFALGPVAPQVDLRNMLTRHLVERSCGALDALSARRAEVVASGEWEKWRDDIRRAVRNALGDMPFAAAGAPLNVRPVYRLERPGYTLENVLFDSLPGLDVNASVFLPDAAAFPPPWPAIVVAVGHSNKVGESYQHPAQIFARCGYAAITFDPPGAGGEKQQGNDHFRDGVRCYLTGDSANRYFIIDALRCVDYLASRPDIDLRNGVGITGVSGGGVTSMYAALLDDRIAVCGPSCCAVPKALHPILDHYAECPEVLAIGRLREYDDPDLLAAALPKPVLLMAGAGDEVFTESMSRAMADEVGRVFDAAGHTERFSFFLDPGGHAYSPAMAGEFVKWMDRWVRNTPARTLPQIAPEDLEMLTPDQMACRPRQERNMTSITRDDAARLRSERTGALSASEIARMLGVQEPVPAPEARANPPAQVWFHSLQELSIAPEPGIELPATYLYPVKEGWKGGVILYFDHRGRWTDLRVQGLLSRMTRFIDSGSDGPAVLSVDLRGWGDTAPADIRYDLAGWGGSDRWIAYVSAGLGDDVMAMRVRDGLAALAWLKARSEIDAGRIVVGGRGLGGVIALHVAALGGVAGVFTLDAPVSLEALLAGDGYAWPPDAFMPGALRHYDLGDLARMFAGPVLVANPLDAMRNAVVEKEARTWWPENVELTADSGDGAAVQFVQRLTARP